MDEQAMNRCWGSDDISAAMATGAIEADEEPAREGNITITEVWPDQFELTIDADGDETSVTTTHRLERSQLRSLRQRIDEALR